MLPHVEPPTARICVARRREREELDAHAVELVSAQARLVEILAVPATWMALDDGHETRRCASAAAVKELLELWRLPWGDDRLPGDPTHCVRFVAIAGGTAVAELVSSIDTGDAPGAVTLFVDARVPERAQDNAGALVALCGCLSADWGIVEPPAWPTRAASNAMMHAAGAVTFVADRWQLGFDGLGAGVGRVEGGLLLRIPQHQGEWPRAAADDIGRALKLGAHPRAIASVAIDTPEPVRRPPRSASPWAPRPVPAPLCAPAIDDRAMTLEEYASFQAECAATPLARQHAVWLRFGIADAGAKQRLEQSFQQRFAQDPALHGTYYGLLVRYREWLRTRREP